MKLEANKNEVPSKQNEVICKQKWSSKQTKMKIHDDVPRFHLNKNEVPSKQKRG